MVDLKRLPHLRSVMQWMVVCFCLPFFVASHISIAYGQDAETQANQEERAAVAAARAQILEIQAELEKQAAARAEAEKSAEKSDDEIPPALTRYMGRRIAQTMHYAGAPWLIRESREREEGCSLMLKNLGAKPGMTVCDMGCGNGFYALQLAKLVGEEGRVLAVDIQPEMLTLLKLRGKEAGVEKQIKPILGSVIDPMLPAGEVDLIICADVYHEFSHPEQMLANMRKSLSEKGLVVLLEFRMEDRKVPIKLLHKMSKKQVLKEMNANGFELAKEFDGLPWQHMMFFGKDDADDADEEDRDLERTKQEIENVE